MKAKEKALTTRQHKQWKIFGLKQKRCGEKWKGICANMVAGIVGRREEDFHTSHEGERYVELHDCAAKMPNVTWIFMTSLVGLDLAGSTAFRPRRSFFSH